MTIPELITSEQTRQESTLMLIPSENYISKQIRNALGSVLSNKYSEGYPGARYYQGNTYIDEIERHAIHLAKSLFKTPHANVQPYSGSPANAAVYFGLLQPGDTLMGLSLSGGGHLTHGHPNITFSGAFYNSIQYDVLPNGYIDMEKAAELALKHKPKLITVGTTAYSRTIDWKQWRDIADSVGAYLFADISHIAGLVIGNQHPSPVPYAEVITTTTHKTLRGPRGAVIMVTDRGLARDPEMALKIDGTVFPGLQGGPHNSTTAAIALALEEASRPEFSQYAKQIVENAQALAETLMNNGISLVTGGTDNHLMLIDLQPKHLVGNIVAEALEVAGIVTNRNSVPHDPNPPFYPSGLRIGTPAVTTRGMREAEMIMIGNWISEVVESVKRYQFPKDNESRKQFMKEFKKEVAQNTGLLHIASKVRELCKAFPTP